MAVVFANQVHHGLLVPAQVSKLKIDTFLRKVVLGPGTRWSTGLAEDHNFLLRHELLPYIEFGPHQARFVTYGLARLASGGFPRESPL